MSSSIKNGPCQELLTRLQSVEVEQRDKFDDVQEDEEEDCSDSEDSDNDQLVEVVWVDNWIVTECTVNLEFYWKLISVLHIRLQNKEHHFVSVFISLY